MLVDEILNMVEIYLCLLSEDNQAKLKKSLVKASINLEGSSTSLTMRRVKEIIKTSEILLHG